MNRSSQIIKLGLAAGFLAAIGIISFAPGTSAQHEHGHSHAPESARKLQNPLAATQENIAAGRTLYTQHCATCHGEDGKAKTERASTLKVSPADLTSTSIRGRTQGEIYWVVTNGIKESGMPAFQTKMSEHERWQAVHYVKHLQGEDPQQSKDQDHHRAEESARPQDDHAGHANQDSADSDAAKTMHMDHAIMATVTGGPFHSMQAMGSGTSLQPASTPMAAWHFNPGDWMLMLHGELKVGFNYQGRPRGVGKAESQNWLMLMAERNVGPGRLMLRGMFSAEPLTAPHGGFPQLFQTGETYRGRPIVDAQHPHDLFMELAAAYTIPLSERVSINLYGGPVGEPALGPVAFPHRASAMENPAAPLAHHLQDSTHIAHGVITAGVTAWRFRVEGSVFRGAEPDENRGTIDLGKLDSWSGRVWFVPTQNWAMQFSYGHLIQPEATEPGDTKRMTASIAYNRPWSDGNWATTLIWGRNREEHGKFNSYLLESTVNFLDKNYFYTRLELLDREDDLLDENIFGRPGLIIAPPVGDGLDEFEPTFRVGAFTFGGVRDIVTHPRLRMGIGADMTFYHVPDDLKPLYGSSPKSYHIFLRFRPGKMNH